MHRLVQLANQTKRQSLLSLCHKTVPAKLPAYVTFMCPYQEAICYFVRTGNEKRTTLKVIKNGNILLYSAENCKITGLEIRTSRVFKESDCTSGARIRKTVSTKSCCIPELLALKGLNACTKLQSVE